MKLLLTSDGLSTNAIQTSLKDLVGSESIKTAFIPTAANVEIGDKAWLIRNLEAFSNIGEVDIVEIAALPREYIIERLSEANVIVFGGGNTPYLMQKIRDIGLDKEIPRLLESRVYVGISAGSIIAGNNLISSSRYLFQEGKDDTILPGLGLTDINIIPHLNSDFFSQVREKEINSAIQRHGVQGETFLALDDDSALIIDEDNTEVVGEGAIWFHS